MKPGISLTSIFERTLDEKGGEYYAGTLDPATFKKHKKEFRVILMQGKLLPSTLIQNDPKAIENLFMFVETETDEE